MIGHVAALEEARSTQRFRVLFVSELLTNGVCSRYFFRVAFSLLRDLVS